jgi:hypothetical protein
MSMIQRLFRSARSRPSNTGVRRKAALALESLEERAVPSASRIVPMLPGNSGEAHGRYSSYSMIADEWNDGVIDQYENGSAIYSPQGDLLRLEYHAESFYGEFTSVLTQTFGKPHQLLQEQLTVDSIDVDYPFLNFTGIGTYTYDATGKQLGAERHVDYGLDGTIDWASKVILTYDAKDTLTGLRFETDSDFDGRPDDVVVLSYTFDAKGQMLSDTTTLYDADENGELVANITWIDSYTYDAKGRVLTFQDDLDQDGDGVVDESKLHTYQYDANGRVLTENVVTVYGSGEWMFTVNALSVYSYDGDKLLGIHTETDYWGDGTVDDLATTVNTYNAANQLVFVRAETDYGADGVIESFVTTENAYDAKGHLVYKQTMTNDSTGWATDRVLTETFDADGRLLTSRQESDYDNDGVLDSISLEEYRYDKWGNLLAKSYLSDIDADGVFDGVQRWVYNF